MTRIVGNRNCSEFILDPSEALRRGRVLDAMLRSAAPRWPRGVLRTSHAELNAIDDRRRLEAARRINGGS